MKKALLSLSALTMVFTFAMPPVADAHHNYDRYERWKARKCERLERREIRSWKRYNEHKQWRIDRIQHRIDKQGYKDCAADDTIVGQLLERKQFSVLAAALTEADLVDTLNGDGNFTVFAPTDAAFAKLLDTLDVTAEELLANPDLKDILLYHVLGAAVDSKTAMSLDGQMTETVAGQNISIEVRHGELFINDSKVVVTDLQATNGVVHVIDMVLLP